jgi:hypothetical protein
MGFRFFVLLQETTLPTKPPDATVGRLIVQFISDAVAVLGSLSQLVHPGGVLAFRTCPTYPFFCFLRTYPFGLQAFL